MENTPFYPENSHEEDEDTGLEKDSKKKKAPKATFLELLQKKEDEEKPKKDFEIFKSKEEKEDTKEQEAEKETEDNESLEELADEADESSESLPEDTEQAQDAEIEQTAELDQTEEAVVSEQLVLDRIEEVETELEIAEPGSDEEMEVTAAAAFLDRIGEKLDEGSQLNDETMDQAVAEVSNDLQLEDQPAQAPEDQPQQQPGLGAEQPAVEQAAGVNTEDTQEDIQDSHTGASGQANGGSASAGTSANGAGGAGGSSGLPPTGGPGPQSGPNFEGPQTNTIESSADTTDSNHSHGKYVLAGGLLGYLVGRRRGRIKTEKKLLPVQKKMEENIGELNQKLVEKEEKIRKLVVANKHKLGRVNREHVRERLEKEKEERYERIKDLNSKTIDDTEAKKETPRPPVEIETKPQTVEFEQPTPEAVIQRQLTDRQVIEISKRLKLNNVSLEELQRSGRLEMSQLKEVVYEYLQGGQYELLAMKHLKPEAAEIQPLESPEVLRGQNNQDKPSLPTDLDKNNVPDFIKANQVKAEQVAEHSPEYQQKALKKKSNSGVPITAKALVGGVLILLVAGLAAFLGLLLTGSL